MEKFFHPKIYKNSPTPLIKIKQSAETTLEAKSSNYTCCPIKITQLKAEKLKQYIVVSQGPEEKSNTWLYLQINKNTISNEIKSPVQLNFKAKGKKRKKLQDWNIVFEITHNSSVLMCVKEHKQHKQLVIPLKQK